MHAYKHVHTHILVQDVVPEYLTDAEVWLMSDSLSQLEALQLDIVSSDIQELIMDVNYTRQLFRELLASPHEVGNGRRWYRAPPYSPLSLPGVQTHPSSEGHPGSLGRRDVSHRWVHATGKEIVMYLS